ncbi:MAG: SMC family ATPase [Candidatus ainarchaeum sp.]|nr:SMC family ATPase [Candidatus ainarchaeum sp.]
MIRSITLNNWKTHKNTKIEFNKGTNLFIGQMGSGKSSIVDAICYALFGSFPSLQNRKIKLDEVIMFKPQKEKQAKVILELTIDQNNYRIEREIISEKTNTAKIYKNDKLFSGPKQTDVNQAVSEILNIDYNLFVKIVYGEQNELDYFLKLAPAKRKEQFDDLFGISQLDLIKDNARKVQLDVEKSAENHNNLIEQVKSQIADYDVDDINKEIELTNTKLEDTKNELMSFSFKKEELEKKYLDISKKKQIFEKITLDLKVTESKIDDLSKQIDDIEKKTNDFFNNDLLFLKEEINRLKQEFNEKQKKNFLIDTKTKDLENRCVFFKDQEQKLLIEKKKLEDSLFLLPKDQNQIIFEKELMEKEAESLQSKKLEFLSNIKELEIAISELKKGFFNCPVCDSVLTKEQITKKIEDKTNDLLKIKENLALIQLEITNNQKIKLQLKEEEEKLKENTFILQKIKKIETDDQLIKENINKINKDQETLEKKEDLSDYDLKISNILLAIDYNEKKQLVDQLLKKKQALRSQLSEEDFDEEKYNEILKELGALKSKLDSLNLQKENLQKMLLTLETNQRRYFSLLDQKEKQEQILKKLNQVSINLTHFIKATESSQKQLRTVLVDNINKILSIIWSKIYPYNDYISARLRAESDYILEVLTTQKTWIRVEGILSGGERTCAALSIRVAVALCLTKKLGLLVLDEPTHNLDQQGISMLSKVIDDDLPSLVDQIFIVTHEPQLLNAVTATKYSVLRDKENDGATVIE